MYKKKVLVTGCFDLLHPAHILFLKKAATFGSLHVSVGSDLAIRRQKNKTPTFDESERCFMLKNVKCVDWVGIPDSPEPTGFMQHLHEINPDIFVINEDGHSKEKQKLVEDAGVVYQVLKRDHFDPSKPTSSTDISGRINLPTRISLCSGFLDNPTVSRECGSDIANLVVVPIEQIADLQERSGMATSTRKTAQKYFGNSLPTRYSSSQLGEILFHLENPPTRRSYISGTLDSYGIISHGVRKFQYLPGEYIPAAQEVITNASTLEWLESHLYLKHAFRRPMDCEIYVDSTSQDFASRCRSLNDASISAWNAIISHDIIELAEAMNQSRIAQTEIVRNHCPKELSDFIHREKAMGSMIMGAGGGGYVAFLASQIPNDGIPIRIRRGPL